MKKMRAFNNLAMAAAIAAGAYAAGWGVLEAAEDIREDLGEERAKAALKRACAESSGSESSAERERLFLKKLRRAREERGLGPLDESEEESLGKCGRIKAG